MRLPYFLLFLGPPGTSLTACQASLRSLADVHLAHFGDAHRAITWANENAAVVVAVVDETLPTAHALAFLHRFHAWPGPRPHTLLMSDDPILTLPGGAHRHGIDDIISPTVQPTKLVALLRGAIGLREAERNSWERTAAIRVDTT